MVASSTNNSLGQGQPTPAETTHMDTNQVLSNQQFGSPTQEVPQVEEVTSLA